jgi:hypothetical protein
MSLKKPLKPRIKPLQWYMAITASGTVVGIGNSPNEAYAEAYASDIVKGLLIKNVQVFQATKEACESTKRGDVGAAIVSFVPLEGVLYMRRDMIHLGKLTA